MKSIATIILALVAALFVSTPAMAEEPLTAEAIEADYQQNIEYCRSRTWSSLREIQDLEFKACVERARRVKLEMQLETCETSLRGEFEAELREVYASMRRLQAQLESASAPAAPAVATVPVSTGSAHTSSGANFRVVEEPSPMSIYNTPIPGELKVKRLGRGTLEWAEGHTQVRVVVLNRGQRMPISVNQPGQPTGFVPVYADMDGDGNPDAQPYAGLDPSLVDTVYMGWKRHDDLVVWYLVPIPGKFVEVVVDDHVVREPVWTKAGPGAGYGGNTHGGAREASAQDCVRKVQVPGRS